MFVAIVWAIFMRKATRFSGLTPSGAVVFGRFSLDDVYLTLEGVSTGAPSGRSRVERLFPFLLPPFLVPAILIVDNHRGKHVS